MGALFIDTVISPTLYGLVTGTVFTLKAGLQYIVSVLSQPEAINFSMGIDATELWSRTRSYSEYLVLCTVEEGMANAACA